MAKEISRIILWFLGLIALQVLVLNNLHLSMLLNPYVYPLFILLLPLSTPAWLLLLLSFVTGITIDIFTHSPGVHAFACVFMGYVRPAVLQILTPRNGYDSDDKPTVSSLGISWFLSYASILVFLHHFVYFFMEVFSFHNVFYTLRKIILSSLLSLIIIVIIQYLFYSSRKRFQPY